jgi:ABC-type polysaccharide/polyol phosphate export permease
MKEQFRKLFKYRWLLHLLVQRDLKSKYRRSFLGYLWSLLNPILMMIVISAVFSYVFKSDIKHFPVYLLAGQVIFNFYADATSQAMGAITTGEV